VKLRLDLDACTGHGRCYELAPELFGEDERGHSVLERDEVPSDLEERARAAEANCPERAISIER
jgi:ferredoxin